MKRIIDGKTYNTDTATMLAEKGTGSTANFSDWFEELHVSKKGAFFVNYWGGAMTSFAESFDNGRSHNEGRGIRVLSKSEALDFIDSSCYNLNEEKIEEVFNIEEA